MKGESYTSRWPADVWFALGFLSCIVMVVVVGPGPW